MRALSLDPGALRRAVDLQQQTRTADGAGGFSEGWTTVATVFARIVPLRADSRLRADQLAETVTHRIVLRWRAGVVAGMRFASGGRVFDIVTVHDPDETGRYLECRVREDLP